MLICEVMTASSSGKALPVTRGRGRLSSPSGHSVSVAKPLMYTTMLSSCPMVSTPPKAGIISEKPRDGPPSKAMPTQSHSGSRLEKLESVKSGSGSSKPRRLGGAPLPVAP